MLITNKKILEKFTSEHRLWQGIPSIETTVKGRIFYSLYSGGVKEEKGNFVLLIKSDDGGKTFSQPIAVAFNEKGRCYDSVLWMDPLGRLWFTWSYASDVEEGGVYACVCNEPDANELSWSSTFKIGKYVMMNKPNVLSSGEWLFPIAVWDEKIEKPALSPEQYDLGKEPTGAFVYKTLDNGKTFFKQGVVVAKERSFDEHMFLEKRDGTIAMFIRTSYGIAVSYSSDKGKTWGQAVDSKLGGPSSRFFIKRLPSGRILLINHYNFTGRNNLTALLSEDDGKTYKYSLLLDERDFVSYPDATVGKDGYIYITYDRERGTLKNSLTEVYACAREIIMAKITEEDIINGKLISPKSELKKIVSKLGEYVDENPFEILHDSKS